MAGRCEPERHFDTNSNEHTNVPNPDVLIFDVTEAVSTLNLQTNEEQKEL
jgi:hypothetical protein